MKWAAGILLMAAWITPSYAAAPADLAAYQALAQQDLRLATIGYRLAQANAPFCDRKTLSPGWVLHDEAQYPDKGLATSAFVFRSPVARSSVVSGGEAAQLGLQPGDGIAAVDGIDAAGRAFSLSALMRGEIEPERLAASSPMYKSVGGGLQDVVIAEMVLGRALEAGLVTPLPISFLKKGS